MRGKFSATLIPLMLGIVGVWGASVTAQPEQQQSNTIQITVDTAAKGIPLSPNLYGIFYEEINHAGDGGLYAEKLRDRRFEEGIAHWKPIGTRKVKQDGALLQMEANAVLETEGYWGIGVGQGKALRFTATLVGGAVRVELVSPEGVVLASGILKSNSKEVKLTPNATHAKAKLRLTALEATTLSAPSLMPLDTYKNVPMRRDLAEMIAGMKPSFIRFPGGCFVEGDRLADRFQWKTSLGNPATRGANQCLWGYKATNGLGYHEFLQWAEDMGAEPLFVVNCGMAHRDMVPMEQMDSVVQDALDAIEYANGDSKTTRWGAERAKNGHPKPFGLDFLQIGNENGGAEYDKRYALLYNAIKKRYPQMNIIANDWGGVPKSAPLEIVDEHYYSSPQFFQRQATRYDSYPRTGPKIYIGEFAVTQGCGTGNLIAALGEAYFMTGMERNADVVVMSSYAPLLVNANDRRWNPDAIVFDSARAYGTPSYWVQRMFSENRGTHSLPTLITESAPIAPDPTTQGQVGVGTWRTQAEFADIRVNGEPIDLKPVSGSWERTSEQNWRQTDLADDRRALGGSLTARNYTLTLKAKKISGAEGFLILFYVRSTGDFLWWNIGGWGNNRHNIELAVGGGKSNITRDVPGRIEEGRWYDIKIVCEGRRVQCYLDNTRVHDAQIPPPANDLAAVSTRDKNGDLLVKVVNMGKEARPTKIHLKNAPRLTGTGTVTVLTSTDPMDENSFENPKRIVPTTQALTKITADFTYTVPAYSVSILRLPVQ